MDSSGFLILLKSFAFLWTKGFQGTCFFCWTIHNLCLHSHIINNDICIDLLCASVSFVGLGCMAVCHMQLCSVVAYGCFFYSVQCTCCLLFFSRCERVIFSFLFLCCMAVHGCFVFELCFCGCIVFSGAETCG